MSALRTPTREAVAERVAGAVLLAPVFAVLAFLGVLLVDLVVDGAGRIDLDFLTNFASTNPDRAGILSGVVGSVLLMVICVATVLPLGVATALYLEEHADRRKRWVRLVEANLANLAAVPSIVYGILGLAFLVRGPLSLGNVLLAGGLTLALLVLPIVVVATRDAIRAVPPSVREGALALGATPWEVSSKVVLPAAIPGIATGMILAVAEALGQAAPLLMIGAAAFVLALPEGPLDSYTALPIQIFGWTSRPQDDFRELAAAGILVLLALLLVLNGFALWARERFRREW